jgi:hypothetical protein
MVGHRLLRCAVAALAVVAVHGGLAARELTHEQAWLYQSVSILPPTTDQMTVCYSFSCTRRWRLDFTAADRKRVSELLAAGKASAAAERKAVQQAVVWFERRIGPIIGTDKRVANADIRTFDAAHNFDCFDTTRNTTSLLLIMQDWGLLKHHVVGDPRFRGNLLLGQLPHNTAVLIDRGTGDGWVVDMWPRGYAELPDVMTVEQWMREN